MPDKRKKLESSLLGIYEDISRLYKQYLSELPSPSDGFPALVRIADLLERIESERKMIEELSPPCKLILEQLSFQMNKEQNQISFALGKFQSGRASVTDFRVKNFGNVYLYFGDFFIQWRDAEYDYYFYPDKITMVPSERDKPEISLIFNLSFKHSRLLDYFADVAKHSQTAYWHDNLENQ